jgi:hypothetical protein
LAPPNYFFSIWPPQSLKPDSAPDPNITQDWRISSTIHHTINSIPADSFWSAQNVNRSVNFCIHYVAQHIGPGQGYS